jgi:hypothetical protein
MNEPKQITENELAILFCEEACNDIACSAVDSHSCRYRNAAIKIAKSYGWVKPKPTPEEEFESYLSNQGLTLDEFGIAEKALEIMAKIRKEYESGK